MSRSGSIGAVVLGVLVAMAVLAPAIKPGDPLDLRRPDRSIPPFTNARFPLGTDQLGRDVWAELLYGARVSFIVGVAAATGAIGVIGITIGTLTGFLGGRADWASCGSQKRSRPSPRSCSRSPC